MSDEKTGERYIVTSYHQTGGITAGQVHIGQQPRIITSEDKATLLQNVPHDKPVEINAQLGDGESFQAATLIFQFLKSHGYDVDGVGQVAGATPLRGAMIYNGGPTTIITVGPDLL